MRTATRIIIRLDKRNTGFRFYAFKRGKDLGIHGSIAFCGDNNSIVVHAEGIDAVLQKYMSILRQGNSFSKVISIMSIPDHLLNSDRFELLPAIIPEALPRIEEPPLFWFKLGLFGF